MKTVDKKPVAKPRITHHDLSGWTRSPASYVQRQQIGQILRNNTIQAKPAIGQANDKYEQQADRVADEVMCMPEAKVQCQADPGDDEGDNFQAKHIDKTKSFVQRQVVEDKAVEDGNRAIQARFDNEQPFEVSPKLESRIKSLKGSGQPLPSSERRFFEPRMGVDLGGTCLHTDANAARIARSIHAAAFTHGQDLVFAQGQYAPGTRSGRKLLAHELTHVVQQTRGLQTQRKSEGLAKPHDRIRPSSTASLFVQRQHIHMVSGRYVGSLQGATVNLRGEVLRVLDRLHRLWSITTPNYNTEYPRVRARPRRRPVPRSLIPLTIAAIRHNERPVLHQRVALGVLSLSLSANVGQGQPNRRSDIYRIQDELHRLWHITNPNYAQERRAVNTGPDPVPESNIPRTIDGIRRFKIAFVSGRWRRGLLRSTRRPRGSQPARVRAQLTPGVPPTAVFRDVVGGLSYRQRLWRKLDRFRTRSFGRSRRQLAAGRAPTSRFDQIAAEARSQVNRVFGRYAQGPALTFAAGTLVDVSTFPPNPAGFVGYLINEDDDFQPIRVRHQANNSRATRPTYTVPASGVTTVRDVARVNHTTPHTIATLNSLTTGAHVTPGQVLRLPFEPQIVRDLITSYISNATRRSQLITIDRAWPGAEMGGRVGVQRFAGSGVRTRRYNYWDAFQTVIHEYLHSITHTNYERVAESLGRVQKGVLIEGGTSLFTDEVWTGIYPATIRSSARLRTNVEGRPYAYDATVIPAISHYGTIQQARNIQSIVRPANMRSAYFLGRTDLLGLRGSNRYRVPSTGVRTLADVAFMTGKAVGQLARLNSLAPTASVTPGQNLRLA